MPGEELAESLAIDHHIYCKPSGLWMIRATIDRGPKYVGKRVKMSLHTKDKDEALKRRDLIFQALQMAERVQF